MLHKLSGFFEIPQRKLALLAGAIKDVPAGFCQKASVCRKIRIIL